MTQFSTFPRRVQTIPNDLLDAVCWRHYGRVDVLPQVLAANRFLARLPAVLPAGIDILLPDLRDQPVAPMIRLWS